MRINLASLSILAVAAFAGGCVRYAPEDTVVGDYLSGRLAAKENDLPAAARAFSSAHAEAPGSVDILREAFFFRMASGDVDGAMPYAEKIVDIDKADDGLASIALAAHAIKSGEYARARSYLDRRAQAIYLAPTANILRAWSLEATSGPGAALASLRDQAGEEYKGFYPLHQAMLSEKAGRLEEARNAYQLSVMTSYGAIEAAAYGEFLHRSGDEAAAREFFELLDGEGGPAHLAASVGLAQLEAGRPGMRFASVTPERGAALAVFALSNGVLQQTASQREAAEKAGFRMRDPNYNMPLVLTQLAIYLDPDFVDARRLAGSILNFYGDHERAIAMLRGVDPSSPYFERSRIEIASALNALGRTEEAAAALREAARMKPGAVEARLALAELYAFQERYADAVKVLDALIAETPDASPADAWRMHLSRGAALIEVGEWPRAEVDLKRAVEIAPEEASALNYLGYSWAERGENLEEAFELIEKAISLEPNSGAIIDSLGWAHYQLGDYKVAVGHLEHAASLEPGDPTITDHLGDVYWRLGREIEAQYQWRRVLELEPNDRLKTAVEEKLAGGLPETGE